MVKISEFMIGLIFIGFITAVFGLYMTEMHKNYGVNYDNSSFEAYNQLEEMSALSEELEGSTDISLKSGETDILGGYFSGGYNAMKITKQSFNTFDTMSNQAIKDANLGAAGKYLRIAVSSAVLILIVVAVIISAILKWAT